MALFGLIFVAFKMRLKIGGLQGAGEFSIQMVMKSPSQNSQQNPRPNSQGRMGETFTDFFCEVRSVKNPRVAPRMAFSLRELFFQTWGGSQASEVQKSFYDKKESMHGAYQFKSDLGTEIVALLVSYTSSPTVATQVFAKQSSFQITCARVA